MKFDAQIRCSLEKISEKLSWKLENVVSTILQLCNFFTMDDVLVGRVTKSASLKKVHFPKISDQAPLIFTLINFQSLDSKLQHYRIYRCTDKVLFCFVFFFEQTVRHS